jgi:uncharacterized membrane protein YeaQ/YmgE (transglycosylase-associated protein family)
VNDSIFADHFPLLVLLAGLIAGFLCLLWRDGSRERMRFFLKVFLGLVGGALGLAWLMFPFP